MQSPRELQQLNHRSVNAEIRIRERRGDAEHGERAYRAFPHPNVIATVCPSGMSTMGGRT